MSIKTTENQALSLAGVFQAVHLCKALATTGSCDQDDLKASLHSILTLKSDRVVDAYGGTTRGVHRGLRVLKNQLGNTSEARDLDLSRYAFSLMQLGSNILKDEPTVEQLRIGISRAQGLESEVTDEAMIDNFAELYKNSISHLSPRIMVSGDPNHLNDENIAATIRAALLGGIRSVVLWKQCGGSRINLLWQRGQYVKHAEELLGGYSG